MKESSTFLYQVLTETMSFFDTTQKAFVHKLCSENYLNMFIENKRAELICCIHHCFNEDGSITVNATSVVEEITRLKNSTVEGLNIMSFKLAA